MSTNDFTSALPVGSVLKGGKYDYTVEKVLGRGGFGFTYLVSTVMRIDNIEMKLYFAVKEHFVSSLSSRNPRSLDVESSQPVRVQVDGSLKDFRSEARRLNELTGRHPNIVRVNEQFDANRTAYYVMEYVDGRGLNEIIKDSGTIPEDRAIRWIKAIISAVDTIHRARMTHLDIKPANILIAKDTNGALRPVLIDFGLAKHYDGDGNATSTLNTVGCSDGYAPIEQYGGLKTFSPTADIYALGATLYAMLTGTKPPTASEVEPDELRAELTRRRVSPVTTAAVLKAMEYKPGQRFDSADAFLKALPDDVSEVTVIIDDPTPPAPKPGPAPAPKPGPAPTPKPEPTPRPTPGPTPPPTPERKTNWKLILIIAGVVIAGLVVWFLATRSSSNETTAIPDPVYEVESPTGNPEVDDLIRKINACTTSDELDRLGKQYYDDFVNNLPDDLRERVLEEVHSKYRSFKVAHQAEEAAAEAPAVVEDAEASADYDYYGEAPAAEEAAAPAADYDDYVK